ncbi:MAG: hypothetical protein IJD97_01885 [Clostridia bacterium]|nr:hypothetical protein [Clostridia bacterium]MBQ2940965.1 hypothetical protein [Clostridia bacterium]
MKQGLSLAFVYIGLVIGAGFASGREIMEFFNFPSLTDHRGVVLATCLLIAVCYLILRRAYRWNLFDCDSYLSSVAGRFFPYMKYFLLFYLFCGFFTMLAGCGALLNQSYLLPDFLGSLFLLLFCFVVLSFDLKGIVALNAVLVPCMVIGILWLCVDAMLFDSVPVFSLRGITKGTFASAICYVSYNTISAAPVLVPLQTRITPKGIRVASILGGAVLGLLIFVIWLCQSVYFEILKDTQIPLLKLAALSGKTQKNLYTAILLMAICTTAVSQGFGFLSHFKLTTLKQRAKGAAIFCLVSFPFSLLGFRSLVANLYSFFGICGIFWMIWLFVDFFRNP